MEPRNCGLPLSGVTEEVLQNLGEVLWSWPSASPCASDRIPAVEEDRSKRLGRFFDYYKSQITSYDPDIIAGKRAALSSHEDLFRIIRILKRHPTKTRAQLLRIAFEDSTQRFSVSTNDQEDALNLAMKIMVMLNCYAEWPSSGLLENGLFQAPWRSEITLIQFVKDCFPLTDHPSLNDDNELKVVDIKSSLTGKKLKKHAGIKFRPTDDLRRHLNFDRKTAVVEVYHHTAFLKEHLRLTKDKKTGHNVADALELGALPRQLALEALDSIQKILFPLSDPKSRDLLRSLTSTSSFDPDSLRFESVSIRNDDEKDIRYHYFGARLIDLYEELQNPTPRGMDKWFERRSGARYVMMATLIGVVIALMFGMVGLALSSYQSWLAYQQWQHPLKTTD